LAVLTVACCCAPGLAFAGRELYATDLTGDRIFGFTVGADGSLATLQGFPILTGQGPSAVVPSRDATRLYATFAGADAITSYAASPVGTLSTIGASVSTGTSPAAIAISPDDKFLFVANGGSDDISRFVVNSDGSLSSLGASTAAGPAPAGIAMTPNGAYVYVANSAADTIAIYAVSASGDLSAIGSPAATGHGPSSLAITPDGRNLYAANAVAGTVSEWSIGTDGRLTTLGPDIAAGAGSRAISIAPDGTRALVANSDASTISRFLISSTGTLSSAGSATDGPTGARSVVTSPNGATAYVGGATSLSVYDFTGAAALARQAGSPIGTGGSHASLAITPNQGPTAQFTFTPAFTGQPTIFEGGGSRDPDGFIDTWSWTFGDGTIGSGQHPTHVYQQAGRYTTKLTVSDDEGCSKVQVYTGQFASCVPNESVVAFATVDVQDPPTAPATPPPCVHEGDDGFCGTVDHKAPAVSILGFNDGASITTIDAPDELVGIVTPDPSGITSIELRFTKSDGTVVKRQVATRRVCHTIRGKKRCAKRPIYKKTCRKVRGKRRCKKTRVVKVIGSKVPMCLTVSGTKNYLVRHECSKVKWIIVPGDTTFRYTLPVALGTGSYTVQAIATDGAGNSDVLETGRNNLTFKVVNTPSNGSSGSDTTGPSATTPAAPISDTGSPFG
jgi:6-phosphogluconolactonase (cycloisomerase 2 family)/PKD repeat protein